MMQQRKHPFRISFALKPTVLTATVLAALAPQAALAEQRIFYIDHAGGNDAADGRSPAAAWKYAPGDSRATGNAKALNKKFQPGDVLRFKGGVRYMGAFAPIGAGTAENPILLDGSSWGSYRAVMDGGNALSGVRRCTSAADCLGNPLWKSLWRADVPADADWANWLFVDDRPLTPAQYPPVSGAADFDNLDHFLTIPKAETANLSAGIIKQTLPAGLDAGSPVVALWTQGNLISYANGARIATTGVNLNGVTFTTGKLNPYTDRDNHFAIVNAPMMVTRPGLFAMSPKDGTVIFWPEATGALSSAAIGKVGSAALVTGPAPFSRVVTGGARKGVNISGLKNAVVRGFSFTSFSRNAALYSSVTTENVEVSDNIFRSVANIANPTAAISIVLARNVSILRNQVSGATGTRGIAITSSQGPVRIECNVLTDIGHTGIMLVNAKGVTVRGNYLARVKGIHANGISAYMDIRDTVIADNVVVDTVRPLTVHGTSTPYFQDGTPQWKVENNVFLNVDEGSAAVSSWGKTQNLSLTGNFIASPRKALILNATDQNPVVSNNVLVGTVVQPKGTSPVDPSNPVLDPNGNGAAQMAARQSAKVRAGVCS